MTKRHEVCDNCGNQVTNFDIVDDKILCIDCIDFHHYKFKRSHHPTWLVQMCIERLEEIINKNQKELVNLKQMEELELPYCHHKLSYDNRERSIKQINEFLEQYYDLHKFVKQLYQIVRHKQIEFDAKGIAEYLRKRNK